MNGHLVDFLKRGGSISQLGLKMDICCILIKRISRDFCLKRLTRMPRMMISNPLQQLNWYQVILSKRLQLLFNLQQLSNHTLQPIINSNMQINPKWVRPLILQWELNSEKLMKTTILHSPTFKQPVQPTSNNSMITSHLNKTNLQKKILKTLSTNPLCF